MMSNLGAAAAAAVILYVVYRIADRYADTFSENRQRMEGMDDEKADKKFDRGK